MLKIKKTIKRHILNKTGSKSKALKAEQNTYYKALKQTRYGSGLVGSIADARRSHGVTNGNTHFYKHLAKTKGKKYAQAVEKKYDKKLTRTLIGSAALALGSAIVGTYYSNKK